ncbi:hypothetical protein ANCCAN_04232 [Ancylostoma caninum]|uniref:SCP domain-containing protein n=1 Tax=Ancylostoma caninum TaxID=29170 RepID=A0A368H3B8_ANCCA|nr:hypothetical protein ANCCAN_04232 [Ancylostoma caninum]
MEIFSLLLLTVSSKTGLSRFNCTDIGEGALQPSQREHLWEQVTISMRLWIGPDNFQRYNCTLEQVAASELHNSVRSNSHGGSSSLSKGNLSQTSFQGKKGHYKDENDFFYKATRSWLTKLIMHRHKQNVGCSMDSTGWEYRIICLYY